jgi:hypothetical protein
MRSSRALEALAALLFGVLLVAPSALAAPAKSTQKHPPSRAAVEERLEEQPIDRSTPIDYDGQAIPQPKERDPGLLAHLLHESFMAPLAYTFDVPDKLLAVAGVSRAPEAANINDFDEVPNSSWFTNRNHMRALSPTEVREGPFGAVHPTPPYTIKSVKRHGFNPGFNIKDAAGKRWVVKLDRTGYPQLSSGAGVVSSRLVWAAGYNISHDEAFKFDRHEIKLDPDLVKGKDGAAPFGETELARLLELGAQGTDGRYYASASLFLPGTPVGPFSFRQKRKDDPNDRFGHKNRRELRGLYVVYSWINNWDVKDHQSLDTYGPDSANGHVTHYLLDVNGSLGASAEGPKSPRYGYEKRVDGHWMLRRIFTLGFVVEPWRKANQETGIPSVGRFEADRFEPADWKPLQFAEPFRRMTPADAYWGAKIVASFTDAQIAAAIDAAGYEDPRARDYLRRMLVQRRDKIARYWFEKVAPLDFFQVEGGTLNFHDLAVDLGYVAPRSYRLEVEGGETHEMTALASSGRGGPIAFASAGPEISGVHLRPGPQGSKLQLKLSIVGSDAKPVHLELTRRGSAWTVTRVRHG